MGAMMLQTRAIIRPAKPRCQMQRQRCPEEVHIGVKRLGLGIQKLQGGFRGLPAAVAAEPQQRWQLVTIAEVTGERLHRLWAAQLLNCGPELLVLKADTGLQQCKPCCWLDGDRNALLG